MSTHIGSCVVCGGQTACCDDEHALGAGRSCCCDSDEEQAENGGPPIEFCSAECFVELERSMKQRRDLIMSGGLDIFGDEHGIKKELGRATREANR